MSEVRLKLGRLRCGISSKIKFLFDQYNKTKPVAIIRIKMGIEWCTWKHNNGKEAPAWAVNWKEPRASRASCRLSHVYITPGYKANPREEQASGQSAEERAAGLFTEDAKNNKIFLSQSLVPDNGPSNVFIRWHAQTCCTWDMGILWIHTMTQYFSYLFLSYDFQQSICPSCHSKNWTEISKDLQ